MTAPDRRLIEEWLPIAELGIESDRERGASSALPPIYYLHTWWARRPLVISRAAVLASILPADAEHERFIHALGIHGDPVKMRQKIDRANKEKKKLGPNPYGYKRAFTYLPNNDDLAQVNEEVGRDLGTMLVVDPTAGGGSIPLESHRLGCATVANDLNPVAALLLRATVDWPGRFGAELIQEFQDICNRFIASATPKYEGIFPPVPKDTIVNGYLWARTVPCPYCAGSVPLSPNWRIAPDGAGVKLKPHKSRGPGSEGRVCSFQIVQSVQEQSEGTVSHGDGLCPYPDCRRVISGDEIKAAAKSGNMGEQLYAVAYKKRITTRTKTGKIREKWIKKCREPNRNDDNAEFIRTKLEEKLQKWDVNSIIPNESVQHGFKTKELVQFSMNYWQDLFSPRQLLCHGTSVEAFRELLDQDKESGSLTDIRKAAYCYLAIALDKTVSYNSRSSAWDSSTSLGIRSSFKRHDFGFTWSYAEMAALKVGVGYEWAFAKTAKCMGELLDLVGRGQSAKLDQGGGVARPEPNITCKSGDRLDHIEDGGAGKIW